MQYKDKPHFAEAMKHARKLSTLKTRKAMRPYVRLWAQAIKKMLSKSGV